MRLANTLLIQFLLIVLSLIIGILPLFSEGEIYSFALIFLHVQIVLLCCISLFAFPRRPYSLFMIVHVFSLFFFGIAPILQYSDMVTFWGAARLPERAYIQASSIILVSLLLYNIIYVAIYYRLKVPDIFLKLVQTFRLKSYDRKNRLSFSGKNILLLFGIGVFILVFYSYDFNVVKLFLGDCLKICNKVVKVILVMHFI